MENSNTLIYTVGTVIALHFLVRFIWLAFKLTKKKEDS